MPSDFAATPYSVTTLGTNQFPVSAVFVPGTASGNLIALQGGPASTDGNGYTSAPMAVYQATGTNLHTVVDSGTVTANQGGSWAVTANAGTNLNTSALALDTSVNGILLAQGSTTTGEHGPLVQGAVTTGSPSYTTAQTSPLSLTTAGALRVDGSATTQPVSGTFWQATQPVSGTVTANAGTGTFTVAGTVTANQGGTWTVQPGNTANTTPWLTTINQGGNSAAVTATNALSVAEINQDLVDSGNSTTTVLTANSIFTGTGHSTLNYSYIQLYVYSDQSSAASGVMIEFSSDNTNWNDASLFTFTAGGTVPNNGQTYGSAVRGQYYRIAYTNGGTNQTAFRLQTTLKDHSTPADMVTMTTVPNSTNHAMLTKSSIVGLTTGGGGGYVDVKVNPSGTLTVDASGTTIPVSQSGTWTVQPGNTPNTAPWLVATQVATAGGSTAYHNVVSSGTNGTNVKSAAGQVYDGAISNTSASAVYFRFYDTSSAPTVGTTAVKRTIQVPGNGTVIFSWPNGLKFTSGIAWGITAAIADSDTTAISAAVSIDFGYV